MQSIDFIIIQAEPDKVYEMARDVRTWPGILPHYRWVKVLKDGMDSRSVEMAARRGSIPVKWVAEESWDQSQRRIFFRHTGGLTRGMRAEWNIQPRGENSVVTITHDLTLEVPIVRSFIGKIIVDVFFVKHIAGRTLQHMKNHAELEV